MKVSSCAANEDQRQEFGGKYLDYARQPCLDYAQQPVLMILITLDIFIQINFYNCKVNTNMIWLFKYYSE